MNFDYLIELNMRNFLLGNSLTKCDGETIPRLFSKKPKLSISLVKQSSILYILFILYAKLTAVEM